mgnify:CR=1 FL=1
MLRPSLVLIQRRLDPTRNATLGLNTTAYMYVHRVRFYQTFQDTIAGTLTNGIYRSTDAGATWSAALQVSSTTENGKVFPTEMTMKLVDGPFRRFDGTWHFKALGDNACKIEFRLSYEFSSKLFEKIIGPVFSRIANTFIEAFVQRAAQVYGS